MRASTVTALVASLLIGLTAAVGARSLGLFRAGGAAPAEPRKVLVAARNLMSGMLMDSQYVGVRAMRPDEELEYRRNPAEFLRPIPEAVGQRVTARIIEADRPILRADLEPLERPEAVRERLGPGMRPVNVEVTKEQSSGGLVQVGDWVDVYLTTVVETPDSPDQSRSACIGRSLRVIVKRNTVYPIFAPMPEGQPVHYTIEANPYRAALIEFAKGKGAISLALRPAAEVKLLEARRDRSLRPAEGGTPAPPIASFAELDETESRDEAGRVARILQGRSSVGDDDLTRIFAPTPPNPRARPVVMQQYADGRRIEDVVYTPRGDDSLVTFHFRSPEPTEPPAGAPTAPGRPSQKATQLGAAGKAAKPAPKPGGPR